MENEASKKLTAFFHHYPLRQYKKHTVLVEAEQDPKGVMLLQDGIVRQYTITAQGTELTVNVFRPLSFFPLGWCINDTQNHYYYEAITPVSVSTAPKAAVRSFLKDEPDVMFDLLSRVYRGLEGLFLHMEHLMAGHDYGRLIVVLLIAAKRFGSANEATAKIALPMTHADLAAQAGMSRETVTRQLKVLKQNGLLTSDKTGVTIHDMQKLEQELQK